MENIKDMNGEGFSNELLRIDNENSQKSPPLITSSFALCYLLFAIWLKPQLAKNPGGAGGKP